MLIYQFIYLLICIYRNCMYHFGLEHLVHGKLHIGAFTRQSVRQSFPLTLTNNLKQTSMLPHKQLASVSSHTPHDPLSLLLFTSSFLFLSPVLFFFYFCLFCLLLSSFWLSSFFPFSSLPPLSFPSSISSSNCSCSPFFSYRLSSFPPLPCVLFSFFSTPPSLYYIGFPLIFPSALISSLLSLPFPSQPSRLFSVPLILSTAPPVSSSLILPPP